jgi:hypothetical protein
MLEPLVPHVLALLAHVEVQKENNSVTSRLLNQLGVFYLAKAQFQEAEPLMRLGFVRLHFAQPHSTPLL